MLSLTGSTPTLFNKVSIPSQEIEWSCISVLDVMYLFVRSHEFVC